MRVADATVAEDAAPWTRMPSGIARTVRFAEPVPKRVCAVPAQRLFVEKVGLPSPLLNQIKRLAAFQNPEFYKKQSMRLSTAMTPRVISCAEDLAQHMALPRGCRAATQERRDGHHPITQMQLGPVRFSVDAKSQAGRRSFEHRLIIRQTAFRMAGAERAPGVQEIYAALAKDDRRNEMILNDVIRALEDGRSPILLTERKDHLEYFATRLERVARHVVVLQGGMGAKSRRDVRARLAAIPVDEERPVLATGRYIGEGFDDARLDALFLAMPVSWKGTLVQYTGRLHRLHPGKTEVRIYDYVDRDVPMLLRMFEKRLRGYRAIGYARDEAPLGYAEPTEQCEIEYDEDVLGALDQQEDFG